VRAYIYVGKEMDREKMGYTAKAEVYKEEGKKYLDIWEMHWKACVKLRVEKRPKGSKIFLVNLALGGFPEQREVLH
jgi:hypothetical protein